MNRKIAISHSAQNNFNILNNRAHSLCHGTHIPRHISKLIFRIVTNVHGKMSARHLQHSAFDLFYRIQHIIGQHQGDHAG